jgi:glycosyltransferase involved in cell wall biosynthesis
MKLRLSGRRIASFFPWTAFEATGAWSRFQSMWRFFLDQGAQVTLAFPAHGPDVRLRNVAVRYLPNFNMVGAVWNCGQRIAAGDPRSELRGLSQAELSLLVMFEKQLYLDHPATLPWLEEIVGTHDVVTCEYPMLLPLLSDVCRRLQKPLIATSHDALFELHGAAPMGKEKLRQKEVQALSLADARFYCTAPEQELFASLNVPGRVVRNTGDALGVAPGKEDESRQAVAGRLGIKTPHYVLFVGSAHGPNLDAVAEIKQMARQLPDVSFVIAGSCSSKGVEGNLIGLGHISERDLDLMYRGAAAIIVPLTRGTGMSVKTYEAFCYGKAVISTQVGVRGFDIVPDREAVVVSGTHEFAAAIRRVLSDHELRLRVGAAARRYALELDFRKEFQPYADAIERLCGPADGLDVTDAPSVILVDNNLSDRVGHHFNYALSLREQCRSVNLHFQAFIKKTASSDILRDLDGHAVFEHGLHGEGGQNPYPQEWGTVRAMYDFLASNEQFARELEQGLQGRAGAGDVVFLPNATPKQILGLALLLKKSPIYRQLRYVVLLRYTVNLASGPITARKNHLDRETAEQYVFSFDKLLSVDPCGSVRLVTDSEELAKEYTTLAKRQVHVLPIPHTSIPAQTGTNPGIPSRSRSKLRVVFMGDARDEKGFQLLPAVVRACSKEPWASRVEFVIQAFVSSHYHMAMGAVVEELLQLKAANLHLVTTSLSASAYQHLLGTADLVLLPYDALTYRARTSGPFVEAICAGKPVVVPKQSWMSLQLGDSGAGRTFISGNAGDLVAAVQGAIQNHAVHLAAAETLSKRFREYHNAENFIRQLSTV